MTSTMPHVAPASLAVPRVATSTFVVPRMAPESPVVPCVAAAPPAATDGPPPHEWTSSPIIYTK
jgi:hypothetical protein